MRQSHGRRKAHRLDPFQRPHRIRHRCNRCGQAFNNGHGNDGTYCTGLIECAKRRRYHDLEVIEFLDLDRDQSLPDEYRELVRSMTRRLQSELTDLTRYQRRRLRWAGGSIELTWVLPYWGPAP
jgi:hypothetical protein